MRGALIFPKKKDKRREKEMRLGETSKLLTKDKSCFATQNFEKTSSLAQVITQDRGSFTVTLTLILPPFHFLSFFATTETTPNSSLPIWSEGSSSTKLNLSSRT